MPLTYSDTAAKQKQALDKAGARPSLGGTNVQVLRGQLTPTDSGQAILEVALGKIPQGAVILLSSRLFSDQGFTTEGRILLRAVPDSTQDQELILGFLSAAARESSPNGIGNQFESSSGGWVVYEELDETIWTSPIFFEIYYTLST